MKPNHSTRMLQGSKVVIATRIGDLWLVTMFYMKDGGVHDQTTPKSLISTVCGIFPSTPGWRSLRTKITRDGSLSPNFSKMNTGTHVEEGSHYIVCCVLKYIYFPPVVSFYMPTHHKHMPNNAFYDSWHQNVGRCLQYWISCKVWFFFAALSGRVVDFASSNLSPKILTKTGLSPSFPEMNTGTHMKEG